VARSPGRCVIIMLDDYDVYSRQRPTMSAQNRRSLEWWKMSASPLGGSIASGRPLEVIRLEGSAMILVTSAAHVGKRSATATRGSISRFQVVKQPGCGGCSANN
jgi:hypothetical protein